VKTRHDDGTFVIEEHDIEAFGEHRFAVDRRDNAGGHFIRTNVGWYRTYRGALNAVSMEKSGAAS